MNSYSVQKIEIREYATHGQASREYLKAGFWLAENGFSVTGEGIQQ
jgi:hypothetical protein